MCIFGKQQRQCKQLIIWRQQFFWQVSIEDNRRPKDEKDAQPEPLGLGIAQVPLLEELMTFSPIIWHRNGGWVKHSSFGKNALSCGIFPQRQSVISL